MGVIPPANCCGPDEEPSLDPEWQVLCDSGTDPATPFLRRFTSPTGAVDDFTLDGVTPYVVTGDVVVCADPEFVFPEIITVEGTVEVSNFPAVQEIEGSVSVEGTISVDNFPESVEISNDVGNPLPVNGTVEVVNDVGNPLPISSTALTSLDGKIPDESGTWGYTAGVSGSVTLTGSKRVLHISALNSSLLSASVTINGGTAIPLPAGATLALSPKANLVDPTIVFTGTTSYFVEHVV